MRAFANNQKQKLVILAKDIVENGLSPADLFIVVPLDDGVEQYIVLEGNRWLTALRALENPELLVDAVSPGVVTEFRKLSKDYQETPLDSAWCVIFDDKDDARHWIELRHIGEMGGAGTVRWEADEIARYRSQTGESPIELQALNFLEAKGYITVAVRRQVPTTSFRRLLGTPDVRGKLGIEVREGRIKMLADESSVGRALHHIAQDLASGTIKTADIYRVENRRQYADNLPKDIVVAPTMKGGEGIDIVTGVPDVKPHPPVPKMAKPRDRLIPRDCVIKVADERIRAIEFELRRLSLEGFPNAVSVLFRVFIELSTDAYIGRIPLSVSIDDKLSAKLIAVTNNLVSRKELSKQQAAPVRNISQKDSYLAPAFVMNQWVHNPHMVPGPSDLRADWDKLQPFVTATWAP